MAADALFFQATPAELAQGLVQDADDAARTCLICGERFEDGRVYALEGGLFEASRAATEHVRLRHGPPSAWLLALDKRLTGLTDTQTKLFACLLGGMDDRRTAQELGITSSTVRNHRFQLREREKQARVFLALMSLLERVPKGGEELVENRRTATMVDERWAITEEEFADTTHTYFPEGPEGPLRDFPAKEKRKLVVLMQLAKRFAPDRRYTEKEVNEVLKAAWPDFATLRRYLIEYGFLDRERDGSAYWVKR
jgi:DNA-binding CsgD family transcriptional regulator